MNGDVTPLYIACQDGQTEAARVLVKYGANINLACDDGSTPLHAACNYGHASIVEMLLQNNAKMNVKWGSRYPLDMAQSKNHTEIVKLFQNKKKDIRWSFARWVWLGHLKEENCLLSNLPKELVKEIADVVNKDVEIL